MTAGLAPTVLAKVEYFNPGGSVKDRIALRMIEAAEQSGAAASRAARSSSRRRATPASGWRSSPSSKGYQCVFVCPDKVSRGQDQRAAGVRRRGRGLPDRRRPRGPATPTTPSPTGWSREIPGAWKPDQYSNPNNPRVALRDDRPGDLGADRRPDHALRRRRRHRRHDQRHRPLPQGGLRRAGAGHRRRPGGLGLLRRHRPALPRRGRRRGLLAGRLRPRPSPTRSSPSPTGTRSR